MKKEDKGLIIGQLTEIVKEYPNFYLTDIEALDAEKTSKLRRECFKKEIKLVVVKNNLLKKALENVELYETMRNLPKQYSEVLILYYVNGLTGKEIADLLEMKESAVMQRLSRARKKLREEMKFHE